MAQAIDVMAAPFAWELAGWIYLAITSIAALLSLAALLHCALQKPDVFPVVGSLSKGAWLAILAGSMLLAALGVGGDRLGLFGLIALCASLIYLLDVRPAIRDIGTNSW